MDHIYNTSEADKATKLKSQKWMTYFVMQIFQKLDKFSMLEGLISILAEKILHETAIFYRAPNFQPNTKPIPVRIPLSITRPHQVHHLLELIPFYLSREGKQQTSISNNIKKIYYIKLQWYQEKKT